MRICVDPPLGFFPAFNLVTAFYRTHTGFPCSALLSSFLCAPSSHGSLYRSSRKEPLVFSRWQLANESFVQQTNLRTVPATEYLLVHLFKVPLSCPSHLQRLRHTLYLFWGTAQRKLIIVSLDFATTKAFSLRQRYLHQPQHRARAIAAAAAASTAVATIALTATSLRIGSPIGLRKSLDCAVTDEALVSRAAATAAAPRTTLPIWTSRPRAASNQKTDVAAARIAATASRASGKEDEGLVTTASARVLSSKHAKKFPQSESAAAPAMAAGAVFGAAASQVGVIPPAAAASAGQQLNLIALKGTWSTAGSSSKLGASATSCLRASSTTFQRKEHHRAAETLARKKFFYLYCTSVHSTTAQATSRSLPARYISEQIGTGCIRCGNTAAVARLRTAGLGPLLMAVKRLAHLRASVPRERQARNGKVLTPAATAGAVADGEAKDAAAVGDGATASEDQAIEAAAPAHSIGGSRKRNAENAATISTLAAGEGRAGARARTAAEAQEREKPAETLTAADTPLAKFTNVCAGEWTTPEDTSMQLTSGDLTSSSGGAITPQAAKAGAAGSAGAAAAGALVAGERPRGEAVASAAGGEVAGGTVVEEAATSRALLAEEPAAGAVVVVGRAAQESAVAVAGQNAASAVGPRKKYESADDAGGGGKATSTKSTERIKTTATDIFAVAWEAVAGERKHISAELLETCHVGFEAVAVQLKQQLNAVYVTWCRSHSSAAVAVPANSSDSEVAALESPPAVAVEHFFDTRDLIPGGAVGTAGAQGTAAATPSTAVSVSQSPTASANALRFERHPAEADTMDTPSLASLFQDLACAHLLSAALQLRSPCLQLSLHAATAIAASLALLASAAASRYGRAPTTTAVPPRDASSLPHRRVGHVHRRGRRKRPGEATAAATDLNIEAGNTACQQLQASKEIHKGQVGSLPEDSVAANDGGDVSSPAPSVLRHPCDALRKVAEAEEGVAGDCIYTAASSSTDAAEVDCVDERRTTAAGDKPLLARCYGASTAVTHSNNDSAAAPETSSPAVAAWCETGSTATCAHIAATALTAEETALLLRCWGSGGELGTHTTSYISDRFSFCFRGQSIHKRQASCRSLMPSGCDSRAMDSSSAEVAAPANAKEVATNTAGCSTMRPAARATEARAVPLPSGTTAGTESGERDPAYLASGRGRKKDSISRFERTDETTLSGPNKHVAHQLGGLLQSESRVATALVGALVRWTQAAQTTSSSITNALQGFAWLACKRGVISAVDWQALDVLLSPLTDLPSVAEGLSNQQCMDIFEALLLFDCRCIVPRASLAVEMLSAELLRRNEVQPGDGKARQGSSNLRKCIFSPSQLLLWIVLLAKYRVEDCAVFTLAADVLRQPQALQQIAHPALIAACVYAFGKFYASSQQAIVMESMVLLARQQLHRFQLGELSQLLVSLTRADVTDTVLFARSAVKIKRNISAILEGGEDAVAQWWLTDPEVSAEQLVNLCLAFARRRIRDEKVFRGVAQLLLSRRLPAAQEHHHGVNGEDNAYPCSPVGLDCVRCVDLVNLLAAFSRVRILEETLFQEIDERLVQHLSKGRAMPAMLILHVLVAHSKVAYRSPRLHRCLLLALAKCSCRGASLNLSVRDRLRLVQAVDDLGLPLLPMLKTSIQSGVPAELLRGTCAEDEENELHAEEHLGLERTAAWRRDTTVSKRRKRQKARKRKWTW